MLLYGKKVDGEVHIYGTATGTVPSPDDERIEVIAAGEPSLAKHYYDDKKGGIIDEDGKPVIVKIDGVQIIPKKAGGQDEPVIVDPEDPEGIKEAIAEAIAEGKSVTVELMDDTQTHGVILPEGSDFTLDLNGHEYEPIPDENGEYAGSGKTKTQAMQLLKSSEVVIKNGRIVGNNGNPPTKMVIQNYANLTLDNTIVEDAGYDTYVLSNNFGEIHLKNGTQLLPKNGHVAFDLWYGMAAVYDEGVTVYIDTPDVVIDGPIEFGHAGRIKDEDQFLERTHLYVCEGFDIDSLEVINSTSGSTAEYEFKFNEEIGYFELVVKEEPVVEDGPMMTGPELEEEEGQL